MLQMLYGILIGGLLLAAGSPREIPDGEMLAVNKRSLYERNRDEAKCTKKKRGSRARCNEYSCGENRV